MSRPIYPQRLNANRMQINADISANNQRQSAILGVDYGLRFIGLAIADNEIKIAHPYSVLENKGQNFVLEKLKEIITKEKIEKIVVGRPIGLSGKDTEQTKITDEFINFLKNNLSAPVENYDERFTSKMTTENNHAGAAAIILQDYLEMTKD